ncbi:MAG: sulfite exporter TauE/SafE family protein [Patescibacteria group bacterium]|nr:sulfite exporter TauE/SafE family protein [Patescibacteria group bacterium]
MENKEFEVHVAGMTCHSCEVLVERSWKGLDGIKDVKADAAHGTVTISSDRSIEKDELQKSLLDQKYQVLKEAPVDQETRKRPSWSELAGLFALAIGLAWIITRLGGLISGNAATENVGFGTALFLGVLASVSSCLAIVSGLLISSTASVAQASNRLSSRAAPVLMFLTGRVMSYALLGGVLGWLGARLAFSSTTTSLILAAAAAYMILVGLDMLHLLPASIRRYLPGTPKALTHGVMDKAQKSGAWMPALMGGATFFLPCGFTQALQAYALTTGSFMASATILGAFALGTVPGLLIFGLATTSFKGSTGKFIFKVAGALVIVLGIMNLRNGIALAGLRLPDNGWSSKPAKFTSVIDTATNEQVVKMTVTDSGYSPNELVVRTGIPVRWEINNQASGCARSLVASAIGINTVLSPGANVFRFTPNQSGNIPFSCSMGMYRGEFIVAKDGTYGQATNAPFMRTASAPAKTTGSSCGGSGGGCGGCGGSRAPVVPSVAPAPSAAPDVQTPQIFKLTYDTTNDIQPNTFRVKVGQLVRLEIDAKENGSGCMSTITIPGLYNQVQALRQGPMTIEFTATTKGSYDITCAMGVPRGQVIVE